MAQQPPRDERYRRLRPLGEGGTGKVWLIEDSLRPGHLLALKEMAEPSSGREDNLRAEFATLSALRHPNLVEVHDFAISPETGFAEFTLEYVDGPDIADAIREEGPDLLLDLAAEALRALSFLHDFGLVHRDLKPGNLLVRRRPKLGCRLVILDFGMALQSGSNEGEYATSGTLAYMAPELFAGEAADRRSDLYALGALLHESIYGVPPFEPDPADLSRFIERVNSGARARPPLPDGYPDGLRGWLEELLSPDAASRPAGASEALARLNAACGMKYELETRATRAARLASGPPPGREALLNNLWTQVVSVEEPHLVLLTGEAGSGKTRVLRWLVSEGVRHGWAIAAGTAGLSNRSALELVGRSVDESLEELQRSTTTRRMLVLFDEVEAASTQTLELLDRIAREQADWPFRVVAAFRPAEITQPTLSRLFDDSDILPSVCCVDLPPLDAGAMAEVAERALGARAASPHRVDWLLEVSEGNPLLAESMLVEEGWERGEKATKHPTIEQSYAGRIAALSADTRVCLEAMAVLGTTCRSALLAELCELDEANAELAVEELRRAGIVNLDKAGWSISSRLITDYVVGSLDAEHSSRLHARAAALIEDTEAKRADPGLLARLWRGAGNHESAKQCALRVADLAETYGQPEEAADWLHFALSQTSRRDPERLSLRRRHADLLIACGRYQSAFRALATCLRLTTDQPERAALLVKQARTLITLSRYQQAIVRAQEARTIAESSDLPTLRAQAALIMGMAVYRSGSAEKAIPILDNAAREFAAIEDTSSQAESAYIAASCESDLRMLPQARSRYREALKLARDSENARLEANILVASANNERRAWALNEAMQFYEQARAFLKSRDLERQQAALLMSISNTCADLCRLDRALDLAIEAETIALHAGSRNWVSWSRLAKANALILIDRPAEAASSLEELLEDKRFAQVLGRDYLKLTLAEALLGGSDPDDNKISLLNEEILHNPNVEPKLTLAALLLEMERRCRPECTDAFEPIRARYEEEKAKHPESLEPPLEVRAELAKTRHLINSDSLDAAMETARNAARLADDKDLPALAARAQALLAEAQTKSGDSQQAKKSLRRGRQLLNEAAERIEDAQIRNDFLDHPAYAALRKKGKGAIEGEEDRLLAIYDMIRTLNSETDPDSLLESMLDMALRVVKAERGMILLGDATAQDYQVRLARNLEKETISDAAEFSKNVVMQAGAGKAVLAMDTGQDERLRELKSVSMYGIRSVICVPLRSRGKIIGAVYLDNRTGGALFSPDDLRFLEAFADHAALSLENAQIRRELENENLRLQQAAEERVQFDNIIGRCPAMQQVYDLISKVAESNLPVLIQGDSGTGKELVARAVHYNGPRRRKPFLTENCAAIPETLLESELFGHVRGAFTGAERDRQGLFEQAHTGTLFLDEVGDMPPTMQARLLRVVQEGEVRRVGGERRVNVDVRLIAATHRQLQQEVAEKRFREDLLYRLQVLVIYLPPLRDRPGDIPLLVDHFLKRIGKERGRPASPLRSAVMDLLDRNSWPGNIRQLENTLQRLTLLAGDGPITTAVVESDRDLRRLLLGEPETTAAIYSLERNEEERIREALKATEGNRTRAAKLLGISRATIFRKIKQYEL